VHWVEQLMARLSPFFPAMVVFAGAVIVAIGGFWASYRQSNFNRDIRQKNEEIAQLQRENADAITGGDNYCFFTAERNTDDNGLYLVLRKAKTTPLFNVSATLWRTNPAPGSAQEVVANYEDAAITDVFVSFKNITMGEGTYFARILTRNRVIIQTIQVRKVNGRLESETSGSWTRHGQYGAIPMSQNFSYPPSSLSPPAANSQRP
jgi:hypothetical protein